MNDIEDLDYDADGFADIVSRDNRYHARAYTLLADVIRYLSSEHGHIKADEILDEFKERALDLFGPMTYTVLTAWGLKETADIGEMMLNLVESGRISRDEDDNIDDFANGYEFKEAFLGPYEI